jgi:hypothetical protein
MSAAIATCAHESFVADVVCRRARKAQYCEGFWGRFRSAGQRTPGDFPLIAREPAARAAAARFR